jgi:hypothetical protein
MTIRVRYFYFLLIDLLIYIFFGHWNNLALLFTLYLYSLESTVLVIRVVLQCISVVHMYFVWAHNIMSISTKGVCVYLNL